MPNSSKRFIIPLTFKKSSCFFFGKFTPISIILSLFDNTKLKTQIKESFLA